MIFLHAFEPSSAAFTLGPLTVHWYGIVMALAIFFALALAMRLAHYLAIAREAVVDVALWLVVGGLIGARLYEIFLEWDYYSLYPSEMAKVWHGGLAIHGALIGGLAALLIFSRMKKLDAWNLAALCLPAVALGQAIGRWGNWFNQELFGSPTAAPWGIPIDIAHRPLGYEGFAYFQPTFLYESLALLAVGLLLYRLVRARVRPAIIIGSYCLSYGALRFVLEFIKIDNTPVVWGLRWPQIASLILIITGALIIARRPKNTVPAGS